MKILIGMVIIMGLLIITLVIIILVNNNIIKISNSASSGLNLNENNKASNTVVKSDDIQVNNVTSGSTTSSSTSSVSNSTQFKNIDLTNSEKIEWNKYLTEKVFALYIAKNKNMGNSEITLKEKAEFVCFWAGSYDRANYEENTKTDNINNNDITYVEGEYLLKILNDNFYGTVKGSDMTSYFTNGYYYIHRLDRSEYTFYPKVSKVTFDSLNNNYIVTFVSLKSNVSFNTNITEYSEDQIESTFELTLKKESNENKIVSIKQI